MTGSDHAGWTPEQARAACALLPILASFAAVPDAAYLVPLEAPAEMTRRIVELWATAGTPTTSTT